MKTLAVLLFVCITTPAFARHHHHPFHGARYAHRGSGTLAGRPRAWCGLWLRQHVGSDPGVEYNLARNWTHWGHAASGPAPGIVGVMPHHVFKVISVVGSHEVLAISGNDGNAVRTRVRSTRGVIAWRQN